MNTVTVVAVGDTSGHAVDELEHQNGPVQIVRRCPELSELLAAAQSGMARAALIASGADQLTATLVDRLTAVGVSTVAVAETPLEAARLQRLGAHALVGSPSADMVIAAVLQAVESRKHPSSAGYSAHLGGDSGDDSDGAWRPESGRKDGSTAALAAAAGASTEESARSRATGSTGQLAGGAENEKKLGRIMAVWGPVGSPGRTMVAVNVAAELAAAGTKVLLIDADSYGASIAASLGLLDESASFAQACRVADQGVLTATELSRICTEVVFTGGSFALLTGLTRPDRWSELRAAAVERVLETGRQLAEVLVIDCGFCLENDEELSYDTIAPRRNAATLSALAQAETIYAVGNGDAIGLPRLIRALEQLPEQCAGARLEIVMNKVRKQAVGRSPIKALTLAWERFGPGTPIAHHLPWEPETTDAALLSGRLLLESAPDSGLRRAIKDMCCAPVQRNRKPL